MKNVLFVSDTFLKGGLESRIISQIKHYTANKINVFLACENFDTSNLKYFKDTCALNKLDQYNTQILSIKHILQNRDTLINFCQKNKIDYIDCHPFFCVLPAVLCANKLNIPISFTFHGVASGDFINYSYPETKIVFHAVLKYGIDQHYAVAEYLKDQYSFLSPNIIIARNGTSLKTIPPPIASHDSGKFAIASRLDESKTNIIINFLPLIHGLEFIKSIDIFGDGPAKKKLESFVQDRRYAKVSFKGWSDNLIKNLRVNKYAGVFGMGKVILDSINAGIPSGILGYSGFAGAITPKNIQNFAKTNLTSWDKLDPTKIPDAIKDMQHNPFKYAMSKSDLLMFDDSINWQRYLHTANKTKPHASTIIQHFNQFLEENNQRQSQEAISTFIENINPLFSPYHDLMYKLLRAYAISLSVNNAKLADYSQKLTDLEKIAKSQSDDLQSILNSKFWKTSQPIRKALDALHTKSKRRSKPEIIAVLCTYNESLNIDGCLSHVEKFVDKIIIFDDGSTDNTIELAKKHNKVSKIIKNPRKTKWNERKNRETVLRQAFQISNKKNAWALCLDADERFELPFLCNLRDIINKCENENAALTVHFRELWGTIGQYRIDGIWGEKLKAILFKLQDSMTFAHSQEHHIPWYYQELQGKEILLDYNLYHLKMVKPDDRQKRVDLYNELDPDKKMQPIGYDYLVDTSNLKIEKIPQDHMYDLSTVPDYYK